MNIDRTRPRIFLQLLACLWLLPLPAGGQVNVSIHITPPYSTKICDYTMQPNKILATLVNVTPDFQALQVYLGGSIQGEGGIRISTRPGSRPADPITLQPGVPYILNPSNLSAIFSPDQLVYEGITQREIIYGNGLPEDVYTICLRVYDYTSQQPGYSTGPSSPECSDNMDQTGRGPIECAIPSQDSGNPSPWP
jgi:TANFOR domain-containing protein